MRTFWKILCVALLVGMLVPFLVDLSMFYWPSIPSSPRPAEGRVYPLNNHGHYTYMNRREHLLDESVQWIFLICLPALMAIQHFVDPFEMKRRRRLYGQPPRDFQP
jgi:hypothetical protein